MDKTRSVVKWHILNAQVQEHGTQDVKASSCSPASLVVTRTAVQVVGHGHQ